MCRQGCINHRCNAAWQLKLVWWCLIFVGPTYRNCFMLPFWCLEFGSYIQKLLHVTLLVPRIWGDTYTSGKYVHPWHGAYHLQQKKQEWKYNTNTATNILHIRHVQEQIYHTTPSLRHHQWTSKDYDQSHWEAQCQSNTNSKPILFISLIHSLTAQYRILRAETE